MPIEAMIAATAIAVPRASEVYATADEKMSAEADGLPTRGALSAMNPRRQQSLTERTQRERGGDEPGGGTTALLEYLVERASGFRVVRASGNELARDPDAARIRAPGPAASPQARAGAGPGGAG
jgi:hypothetical protein